MKFQQNTKKASSPFVQGAFPTIGIMSGSLNVPYCAEIGRGAIEAARHRRVNVLFFREVQMRLTSIPGRRFDFPVETLYDFVSEELLDGLILVRFELIHGDEKAFQQLCHSYKPLPLLTIGSACEGVPGILSDNDQGMRDVVSHLIDMHQCRRIACIQAQDTTHEVHNRYVAYTETLEEYGIPIEPDYIVSAGNDERAGAKAVQTLIDERHLQPKTDFDAIVACHDRLALGAMEELQRRGVRIPYDVAVTGYGDTEAARLAIPPLTTVHYPTYDLGYTAVEIILAGLGGEDIPETTSLPTTAKIRISCGCQFTTVSQISELAPEGSLQAEISVQLFAETFTPQRDVFLKDIARQLAYREKDQALTWSHALFKTFATDVEAATSAAFLPTLEQILREFHAAGGDVSAWHGAIALMRHHLVPYLDTDILSRAEECWQQAHIVIADMVQRLSAYRIWEEEQQIRNTLDVGQSLNRSHNVETLLRELAAGLLYLQIPRGYLCLYEDQQDPGTFARLLFSYRGPDAQHPEEDLDINLNGRRFLSRQILPDGVLSTEKPYQAFVSSLSFDTERFGHVIFEFNSLIGSLYESVRWQLSGALKGEQLLRSHLRAREILALQPLIEEMLGVATQLGKASDELNDISMQMATGAEQTTQQASDVSAKSREISRIVRDMSKAVEEEAANIQEIARTVTKVSDIITQAVTVASAANTTMESLESHSQQIGNIIKTITDIADQTDLLALNATIKAAQAGDYGRGFAVVAENVKALAWEASQAAEDIERRISTIQHDSQGAARAITQVVQHIREVSNQSGTIAAATSQQTATTHEISQTITQVVDEAGGIAQAMAEVVKATQRSSDRAANIQQEALKLSSIAEQLRQFVQEIQEAINSNQTKFHL